MLMRSVTTICPNCHRAVYRAPDICELCGATLEPTINPPGIAPGYDWAVRGVTLSNPGPTGGPTIWTFQLVAMPESDIKRTYREVAEPAYA